MKYLFVGIFCLFSALAYADDGDSDESNQEGPATRQQGYEPVNSGEQNNGNQIQQVNGFGIRNEPGNMQSIQNMGVQPGQEIRQQGSGYDNQGGSRGAQLGGRE